MLKVRSAMENKEHGTLKLIWVCVIFLMFVTDVANAARLPSIGGDSGDWGSVLNDFLAVGHTGDGKHRNVTVDGNLIVNNSVLYVNGSSGYVGIGTSRPDLHLTLQGMQTFKNAAGTTTGWISSGDSVFTSIGDVTDSSFILRFDPPGTAIVFGYWGYEGARFERTTQGQHFKLGIGTPRPAEMIHIAPTAGAGASAEIRFNDTDTSNWWDIGEIDDDFKIALNDSATDALLIDQDGNVGIGTNNPRVQFSVVGSQAQVAKSYSGIDAPTGVNVLSSYLHLGGEEFGTNSYRLVTFGYRSTGSTQAPAYMGFQETALSDAGGSATKGDLVFGTRPDADPLGSPLERLRITTLGRVGIGTTSPSQKLDVAGNVSTSGGNLTVGSSTDATNMTYFSPNGNRWRCGVTNSGAFSCTAG